MVGAGRRRVVAVVGGEHEQIVVFRNLQSGDQLAVASQNDIAVVLRFDFRGWIQETVTGPDG